MCESNFSFSEQLNIDEEIFNVKEFLGKGKSAYSYLITGKQTGRKFVYKQMHDEVQSYYTFYGKKINAEINAYNILKNIDIKIPKLILINEDKNYLIKEYIEGNIASQIVADKKLKDIYFEQLFEISGICKNNNINIDYFPNNFVIKNDVIFYIDYEINNFMQEWDFENWGIYYWLNSEGFKKFIETRDHKHINENTEKGIPYKIPFHDTVNELIEKHREHIK